MPAGPRLRPRALLAGLVRAAIVALVAFHAWLLALRLRDDTLLEPRVAVRWVLALALLGLAVFFRRRGLALGSGRSGVAFWLLALLLHLGGAPLPLEALDELLVALPLGVGAPLLLALAARFLAGSAPLATARDRARRVHWSPPPRAATGFVGLGARLAPRPPPAVLA